MKEKILTVSVAAYNVEKYLKKLVGSITAMKNRDMVEVLIVDDGSKDRTPDLGMKYQAQYPGIIRYIRKENGGHGSTINTGIREAKGRYFRALDGDDWLDTAGADELVKRLAQESEADAVITDFCVYTPSCSRYECVYKSMEDGKSYSFGELYEKTHTVRYHAVIYRTELIQQHGLTLDEHRFFVDSEYLLFPVPYINRIRYYNLFVYSYRVGHTGQSVSKEGRIRHISDSRYISRKLLDFYEAYVLRCEEKDSEEEYLSKRAFIRTILSEFCIGHIRAMLSLSISGNNYRMIIRFESFLKDRNPEIYDSLNSRRDIRMLRKCGRFGYIAGHMIAGLRDFVVKKSTTGKSTGWKKKIWTMWQ